MTGRGAAAEAAERGAFPATAGDTLEFAALLLTGYASHLYYNLVGHVASLRGVDLGPHLVTPVDLALPYMPFWVLFYQLAYFAPVIVMALLLRRLRLDLPRFRRIVLAFLVMLAVHYVLYLAFPTSARAVRIPEEALGDDTLGRLVRYQYRIATVWCAWPSFHISAGWYFFRLLLRYCRVSPWVYLVWFAGMFIGTVAIKIHHFLDGVTALLLAEAAYRGLYLSLEEVEACRWRWGSEGVRAAVHAGIVALLLGGLPLAMRASGFVGPLYTIGGWR